MIHFLLGFEGSSWIKPALSADRVFLLYVLILPFSMTYMLEIIEILVVSKWITGTVYI